MDRGGNSPPQEKDRPPLVSTPTTRVIRTFEEIRIPVKTEEVYPELECAICSHILGAPQSLVPCGHSFCGPCAWKWIKTNTNRATCPHCRIEISMTDPIVPNIVVDQIVDRKLQKLAQGLEKESMLLDRQEKLREWKDLKPQLEHFQRQMRTSRIVREVDTVLPNIGEDSGEVEINPRRASRSFAELGAPIDLGIPAPTIEEYIGQSPSRRSQTMAEFHNAMRERRLRALSEFLDTGAIHEFGSSGIQEPSRTPTSRGGGAMATESRLRHRERPYSDSHPQVPPQSTSPITRRQSRGRRVGGTREDPEIVPSDSE
ncbi:hypothetical protein I307_03770 [Cryptococcus deuterogattii 99/473]|uniref:RING-type domain-containing protein n=2 Tax=Cryptococcus deuterogattii TaxID=1859096 RepID=A0A0D0URG6_9TREE|nr:hypothetical protein CNBG_1873 [Cryptococcus deuterogattii R265]KIR28314.1 hypothetical protein I309_02607 [Cryptococcus deuterogattii LA55]KIR35067.1 hypothetical protein I352_02334 [Cryptococcus deuterogattii MMRL2647]KIR37791.1 hypothetical protein I313_06152 [Cryptococcus deuterogattii Ram5]KIR70206.1 hypothetical protein I310_06199 [Cryptococcus deuterogattii CA1014]KIR93797.1 hypothetical protein I304_02473 [Cryptococcus deuterogattii CBS 10090]KIS00065.1 hypothetical protein L804_02